MADIDRNALAALIEAVEAGTATMHDFARVFPSESAYGKTTWGTAHNAFSGDLNAAKALHEALLPGWHWFVSQCRSGGRATVWHDLDKCRASFSADDPVPSRALLLAILRALASEGGE